MKIHVALIEHKHGMNIYASKSPDGLRGQIYEYVSEWWDDICSEPLKMEMDAQEAIDKYFSEAGEYESLKVEQVELKP